MASVTATINVQINAANAAAQLTALQGKVAAMNKGMLAATAGGVMAQEKAIRRMGNVLSGSGMFTTGIRNVHTELGRMHQEFDRGSTTLQKYRQNSRMWGRDHSAINRMAADRVRMLQSQYVALGKEMNGVQKSMQIKPDRMMREFGADAMYAHQRAMLFRRNLQMGSTALVNWGKNTQWAGRQMMVGMGIPIAIAAAGAVKAFNDIEKASISFKRVYGDATTSVAEKSQMLSKMQATVGKEMMKYGVAMSDTLEVSAQAAATGAKGADLIAATRETMRLATLGNMDYNKALGATIAMQTAFNINAKDMASTTDFLNAVENQTILTMEDMASAVPRVAPVIKGLGGNVQDLAIMMTALRQGGVTAEQGANALKSGLGSLLNPTGTAIDQFDALGINLQKVVDTNKGDLIGTIKSLGKELDGLGKYDRQRALESLFGKYQYSRMGALLKNINSKAAKETMRLAKANTSELAKMSQQELDQISSSPMIKLRASIEELKAAAAPLGALFSDVAAKIVSFATPIVSFFANNDIAKWGLVATAGFAALAGVVTMIVGVFANFTGSMIKAGMAVKSFFRLITGQRSLAYVTTDELEASAAANSLATAAERAAGGMMAEAKAAQLLTSQLEALIAAQNGAASTSRRPGPGTTGTPVAPKPSGPGGTPIPAQTSRTPLSATEMALLNRTHLGGLRNLSKDEITKILGYQGLSKNVSRDLQNALATGQVVQGGNARTMLMPREWNEKLANSGVRADVLADQLSRQGRNLSMAPLMQTIGASAGMSHAAIGAWATQGAGAALSSQIYDRIYSDIAAQGTNIIKDADLQRIADTAIDDIAVNTSDPKLRKALEQSGMISRVSINGSGSTSIAARSVVGAQYDAGLSGGIPTLVQQHNADTHVAPSSIGPGQEVTPNGLVVPKGTMEEQRQTARETSKLKPTTSTSTGSTYAGLMNNWDKPRPVQPGSIKDRYQRSLAKKQLGNRMPGMGLMGAGMLAQTAVIGMEMAGKEVPSAVNYAVNGLMGIGMASMFFPTTMQKVTSGIEVAIKSLGPFGLAIGAAVAAIGGTALLWNKINEDARNEGIALSNAMNDAVTGANDVAAAFNNTSYVQEQKLRESGIDKNQLTTAQQFLQSDMGKQFIADYGKIATETSGTIAASSMGAKIASWVVQGVLTGKDVKGLVVAMNEQSPGTGNTIVAQARQLLGGDLKAQNPAEAARRILNSQSMNTASALSMMQNKSNTLNGPGVSGWMSGIAGLGQMATGFSPQGIANSFNVVKSLLGGNSPKDIVKGLPGIAQWNQAAGDRQAQEKLTTASANVWSSALKTAFQNRLAVEAQLVAMRKERDKLERKETKGIASEDDIKRLGKVQKQIDNTKGSMKKFDSEINAGFKNMIGSGNMGDENWYKAQLRAGRQNAKKDSTGMYGYGVESIGASKNTTEEKNIALSSLNSGLLSPQAFSTLTANGKAIGNISEILGDLPSTKVQEMGNALDSMTGTQATNAVTKYGKQFKQMTADLKLTPDQKSALMETLGIKAPLPKGLNQGRFGRGQMPKDLTRKIKEKYIEDKKAKDKPKDQEVKIKAKADTDGAKKKVVELGKAADTTGKKKINIKASVNVGGAEKKIKGLGAAADVGGTVEQVINRVIGSDETTTPPAPLIQIINRIIGLDMSLIPAIPLFQTVNRVLGSTNLPPIPDAIQYVKRVPKSAMGGEVVTGYFASGGMHTGDGKVTGPGGPTDDKVNARLSDGEFVIRASSVDKYGTAFLSAVNRGVYDKNGFAKGSPIGAKKMDKDQRKDYASLIRDANATTKKINALDRIIEALVKNKSIKKLFGGDQSLIYQFARKIVDENDPKQIKKMFAKKKDKGAVRLALQARKEREAEIRDEFQSQRKEARLQKGLSNAIIRRNVTDPNSINPFAEMSTDQFDLFKGMTAKGKEKYKKNMVLRKKAEDAAAASESLAGYGKGSEARMFSKVSDTGIPSDMLSKYADALGMSLEDLANQVDNNMLPKNFTQLGDAALSAKKAMDALAMTKSERDQARVQNIQSIMSAKQDSIDAKVRSEIKGNNKTGNKSQIQLEADMAVTEANNAILQAQVDDINYKYEKQLETFDQIAQVQQAIANLERGRLSVANALSTGDIAAAAMAAQEQRANTAAFMQEQMRNQLTNQQKAQTAALEEQIRIKANENRDIQNQIALITAQINQNSAGTLSELQDQADAIAGTPEYYDAIANSLRDQNAVLAMNTAQLQEQVRLAQAIAPIINNNPVPVVAGSASGTKKVVKKKKVKKKKAFGGWVPGVGNSDNVPLLATPGEFVMRKAAAARFGPTLQAMNAGTLKSVGGSGGVQIDNIIFNINGANLNERDIAEIAVRKMKSLDSATIRGGRF